MRMAAPSPSNSFGFQSEPPVRRANMAHDPEEEALMDLIFEREQRESAASNQNERIKSKIPFPSSLPPLRPTSQAKLRPTGQKLNASGDFYSPVRPKDPMSLSGAGYSTRVNLAISRIKAPSAMNALPSPRTPLRYDQMKTPDRWRSTAMRSNQDEFNASAVRRWEEEDAAQADRLLEKAAREGDDEAMWNDLFYGTKAARARTNQKGPDEPVIYSSSSFPEVHSQPLDDILNRDYKSKSPQKGGVGEKDMLDSDLSTVSTSALTKPPTSQESDNELNTSSPSALSPWKSVSHMLASLTQALDADDADADRAAGADRDHGDSSDGNDEHSSSADISDIDHTSQVEILPGIWMPRWGVVVVVSCLAIGASGFFMEELMGLFMTNSPYKLSKVEQDRMNERISVLQQEMSGFQLSTSEIEHRSQQVLDELQQHMDRMRSDREQHQSMLANEMQELRHYIVRTTLELVEKEREMIQARLKETVDVKVIDDGQEEADGDRTIAVEQVDEKKLPVADSSELPVQLQTDVAEAAVDDEQTEQNEVTMDIDSAPAENEVVQPESTAMLDQNHQVPVTPVHEDIVIVDHATEVAESFPQAPSEQSKGKQDNTNLVFTSNDEELKEMPSPQPLPQENDKDAAESGTIVAVESLQVVEVVQTADVDSGVVEPLQAVEVTPTVKSIKLEVDDLVVEDESSIAKALPQQATISLEAALLLIAAVLLGTCVALRVWNVHRRKQWIERRRQRINQRALLRAEQRTKAMAEHLGDGKWDDDEADSSVETVSLMTPPRDSEDDSLSEQLQQMSDIDSDALNEDGGNGDQRESTVRFVHHSSTSTQRPPRRRRNRRASPELRRHNPQFEQPREEQQWPEY